MMYVVFLKNNLTQLNHLHTNNFESFTLEAMSNFTKQISEVVVEMYKDTYSELEKNKIVAEIHKTQSAKHKKENVEKQENAESEEGVGEKISGVSIQRYKGLGEMNPDQLWETTMDIQNRVLKKVEIADTKEAERLFDVLMGESVEPRKHFIQSHATYVKNLDV